MTARPVDFPAMADFIMRARNLQKPPTTEYVETLRRALGGYPPAVVRAGVERWLAEDTSAMARYPKPAELEPYVRAEGRRDVHQEHEQCLECRGARWIDVDNATVPTVRPCSTCNPAAR